MDMMDLLHEVLRAAGAAMLPCEASWSRDQAERSGRDFLECLALNAETRVRGNGRALRATREGRDYRSSCIASCGAWFACASTEAPACARTCSRLIAEVSSATSTSRMREFAADVFVLIVWRFDVVTA